MNSINPLLREVDERTLYLMGLGDWQAFHAANMKVESVFEAAARWSTALQGVDRPWLVWNAHDDWCLVQQRLVEAAGWTPVVGFDPRVGAPPVTAKAIPVNFNETLRLPFMAPHFVLEFLFLFADRLAFWHSDLLIPIAKMRELAARFDALKPGEVMATSLFRPLRFWRKPRRYWELVGCSTREASRDQFERGAGWWSYIHAHVNCRASAERERREKKVYWDHGAGIKYWHDEYGGKVIGIPVDSVDRGHFSPVTYPNLYKRLPEGNRNRNLRSQLDATVGVVAACDKMGISYADLMRD